MTGADVAGVAEIEAECFSQPWSGRTLAGELENPCAVFFVARSGSRVVGYAGMHRVLDEGYIANVAVTAEFRPPGGSPPRSCGGCSSTPAGKSSAF